MKSVPSNLRRFTVHISVDEGQLHQAREELDSSLSLKEMIETEFDWLHESGIYLDDIYGFRQGRDRRIAVRSK